MSSSTPDGKSSKSDAPAGAPAFRPFHERNHNAPWLVVSLLLHVVAIGVLCLTPVGEIFFQPPKPQDFQVIASAERIEEMAEHYRDRESDVLRDELGELLAVEDELEDILDEKDMQYDELSRDLARDAPAKALQAQAEALKAQSEALQAEQVAMEKQADQARAEKAMAQAGEDRKARDEANRKVRAEDGKVRQAQESAGESQARVGDAQRRARQALAFATPEYEDARAAQDAAEAAQKSASQTQDRATELQEQAAEADLRVRSAKNRLAYANSALASQQRRVADAHKRIEREAKAVEDARKKLAEARAKVEEYQKKQADAEAEHARAKQAAADAKQAADAAAKKAAANRSDRALQSEARKARDKASRAARKATSAARSVESAKRSLAGAKRDVEKRKDDPAKAEKKLAAARENLASQQQRSKDAQARLATAKSEAEKAAKTDTDVAGQTDKTQKSARERQAKAREAQEKAMAALKKAIQDARSGQSARTAVAAAPARSKPRTARPNLRGAGLSRLYDQAVRTEQRIAETYKHVRATEVAMIRSIPKADALKETVVPTTERPKLDKKLLTGKVETASAMESHKKEVEKAETEVDSMVAAANRILAKARDMARGAGGGFSGSLASIKAESARQAQLRALALEDESQRHKDLTAAMKARGAGAAPASGQGAQPGKPQVSHPARGRRAGYNSDPYPIPKRDVKALPARRITARADRHATDKWVYVDTWYTIGPFPNPRRRNIDTQFPPESVIDLDATYTGKNGRKIKWKFLKSPVVDIAPNEDEPYGIYYAYTELWFDQAMDLHIAVGSDDNSRLWIEGQQVWVSGRQLKPWRADEGIRTVHFRKGLNRILYRVENGWKETRYSLLICMKPLRR